MLLTRSYTLLLSFILLGSSCHRGAEAADILIPVSSNDGTFYAPIENFDLSGSSDHVIGELLQSKCYRNIRPWISQSIYLLSGCQVYRLALTFLFIAYIINKNKRHTTSDHLLDPITKERIGTGRGYGFNINPTHSIGINGTGTDQGSAINSNRVFYMKDGETIHLYDLAIVAGTGSYAKYTGGSIVQDVIQFNENGGMLEVGEMQVELTLVEPEMYTEQDDDEEDSEIAIRIEAEGGFWEGIYDTDGTRIGALYQNVIYDANSNTRIGMNQGYSYSFPNESYIQIDLGYSYGYLSNANRRFIFDNGDSMDIFNEIVVHGTGQYAKYTGLVLPEKIVSAPPNPYVSEITLVPPSTSSSSKDDLTASDVGQDKGYDFKVVRNGTGFYEPIVSKNSTIGARFQVSSTHCDVMCA